MLGLRYDMNFLASTKDFYSSPAFSLLADLLDDVRTVRKELNEKLLFLTVLRLLMLGTAAGDSLYS